MQKQMYDFKTAISMVVGIVIGSGIFFKADDILSAVNGNVMLGIAGFIIVGIGVLFGALTISYYALNDEEQIGIMGYARQALGSKFAFLVGWFSISVYFPAFIVVLAMVASIYLQVLLGIDSKVFGTVATLFFLISAFWINIKSPESGGKMQIILTIAKIIPLVIIGLVGTLFFSTSDTINTVTTNTLSGGNPFSMLILIAFAFDGWIVATNISSELKNSEKNLPKALAYGTIGIIIIYCIYFFGITQILSPKEIVELGDAHTEVAAQAILGPIGGKVIITFVIISVYGGLNGMTLAYLRLPKVFVEHKLMKNVFGNDTEFTKRSLYFVFFWITVYYLLQQCVDYGLIFNNLKSSFDMSALPILGNYVFYFILFIMVNKLAKQETVTKRLYYLVISLIAAITSLIVVYGAMQANGALYLIISVIVIICGIGFYPRNNS